MGLASYNSVAFFGAQGAGKTLAMIDLGLKLAVNRKRGLVSNLNLNVEGIYKYGVKHQIDWLKQICDDECVYSLIGDYEQDLLFRYPYTIVMFDEAGILLNSRSWQKNNKNILTEGNQLRKSRTTFLWTAQYADMTDKSLRATVERCAWCDGTSYFNVDRQIDILVWKDVKFFKARQFWEWIDAPLAKLKPVATFLKTLDRYWGPLGEKDKDLFNCYDSHDKIGRTIAYPLQPIRVPSRYYCELPKYYYYQRCPQQGMKFWHDPILRREYEWVEPDSLEAIGYEFMGHFPYLMGRRQKIYDYDFIVEDSIESLALQFTGGPANYSGFVRKEKSLPWGEFESEKPLPRFFGWENYKNLLNSDYNSIPVYQNGRGKVKSKRR